ncbi:ribosome maturation factor RimP [Sneathiella sp.]|uniref:ribosome maturation factor RimP n=1 Tax=Sneathiella sp. TaxID=1964365 RepID=UPI00260985B8|nr:ribosome maturation factor RimP [Sneathiella sp.]MDF2366987.1 ribosome maturation factor RimP [Sneathiella sp.]
MGLWSAVFLWFVTTARSTLNAIEKIEDLITPSLNDMGYDVVRVRLTGSESKVLQIMAEKPDGTMTIEGCAEVSQMVSALLDVEDPISGAYNLEVSSPGIDRPLTRPKDFQRWSGFEAKVELEQAVDGQRRYRGKLLGLENDMVVMQLDDGNRLELPFSEVRKAKLILTDELIAASTQRG